LNQPDRFRFFVTCARGTEGALRRELVALRIGSPKGDTGGVSFEGPLRMAMAVCLHARVAVRVLLQVADFCATTTDELYAATRAVDWSAWLTTSSTIAVHASIRTVDASEAPVARGLNHSKYAALKVKDAVVDVLRDKLGARPDVDADNPDVSLVLHVAGDRARLFLDLAGEPLHRRGYRVAMTDAPLKETLAAAVLALGGVRTDEAFVDPMGGSGTLVIEQALAARDIAPGLARKRFGFERWPIFTDEQRRAWRELGDEARARAAAGRASPAPAAIVYADVAANALAAARRNAEAAGVAADIQFERADIASVGDLTRRWTPGAVCTNPPYGERLAERDLAALYRRMAGAFTRLTWPVVILSGNTLLAREMRVKPRVSHRLFNGALEVRLLRYEPAGPDQL
jgi:putative N6-adenine-specific DNA methylase